MITKIKLDLEKDCGCMQCPFSTRIQQEESIEYWCNLSPRGLKLDISKPPPYWCQLREGPVIVTKIPKD